MNDRLYIHLAHAFNQFWDASMCVCVCVSITNIHITMWLSNICTFRNVIVDADADLSLSHSVCTVLQNWVTQQCTFLSVSVACVHVHHCIFIWLMQNQIREVRLRNLKLNEHRECNAMQCMDRCWSSFFATTTKKRCNRRTTAALAMAAAQHPLINSTNAPCK